MRQPEQNEITQGADLTAVEPPSEVARHHALPAIVSVRTVLTLALPAIIEQLIQAAVGITDTVIAGHLPGDEKTVAAASAAVGVMAYVQWMAALLNSAFAVGAIAIVSRAVGAKRTRVANRVAGTALTGAFTISVALAAVLFIFSSEVAEKAGLHGLAHTYGTQYLHIMVITIALQTASMIGLSCLRGAGDTVTPMLITGSVAALNILTSSCFSFGLLGAPAWGIRGNAFGTMVAFLIGGVATAVIMLGGWSRLHLQWRHLRIVPHVLWRLLRIGTPSWLENMLLWGGQAVIVVFVISVNDKAIGLDGVTMAAHNAVIRVESLAFLPGFGFGIACSALVGQYLGAGRADLSARAAKLCNRLTLITMTLAALPMVVFPRYLLSLVVNSPPVVEIGVWPLILAGLAQPGFAINIGKGSALKGAGETIWPMMATILGMVAVRLPILFGILWLMRGHGITGKALTAVWIGILLDLSFRGGFNWLGFARGTWRTKRV